MNYVKTSYAAVIATAVMTAFLFIAPKIGLPKMDIGAILGALFGGNELVGWVLHFLIGIIFAFVYVAFFNNRLPVESNISRGAIYGIFVFLVSEVLFTLINLAGLLKWDVKESMGLMVFGNAIAFIIYGGVLGGFFDKTES